MHPIDWPKKRRQAMQTAALCLLIALLQWSFVPQQGFSKSVVYSLCIGLISWAVIDFGRHGFPSSKGIGWPSRWQGVLLVAGGLGTGFFGGTALANALWGHSSWASDGFMHWRISLLLTLLAGIGASLFFYSRGRGDWLENEITAVRRQADEARLKLLESQLEPHMLFNTLANLRALVRADPQRAEVMIDHLVDYLHATLDAARAPLHTLAEECARLEDYLALMSVRMGDRLCYTVDLPNELQHALVPPLILQPLVENSIRHGLEPQVEGGHIAVRALRISPPGGTAPQLRLEVLDDGMGLPSHTQSPLSTHCPGHQGFGLQQVRERLTTLYGVSASLILSRQANGDTLACLEFPCQTAAPDHAAPAAR